MTTPFTLDGSVPLTHWGVIRARGADAVKFLQGQLTNDIAAIGPNEVRLAGFCSAKGRLQASFLIWKPADDELLLACSASLLPVTLKRLSMFVMRAQCKLSDASAERVLLGAVGETATSRAGDLAAWHTREAGASTLVRLPDVDGLPRCLILEAPGEAASLAASAARSLPLDTWRWLEVRSGLPIVEAATVDRFVPQMLNYELVGGVDFRKGCYPGQEVVARSQYRGTIKRRMFLFDCDAPAVAGQEVFHSAEAEQPAGMVVNAAASPTGIGWSALIEVKLAALDHGSLHLGDPQGPLLRPGLLPYDVLAEATAPA